MSASPNKPVNLLFTSAGRRVELLRAFRNAYSELRLEGRIIVTDIDPLAPAIQVADESYLVPRIASEGYIPKLIEICRQEQINAIFPLIDPDIPVLAKYKELVEETGARLGVVSFQAATITRDKWLTYGFFHDLGLPTPSSWEYSQFDTIPQTYPLFIKPRTGSAGQSAFRVDSLEQFNFLKDYVPNPIVQSYVVGDEITCDVICDFDGDILGISQRQRIEVRSGEVSKGKTVFYPFIQECCIKIVKALPAIGPITVQCIIADDVPYFTEINARMGGGLPLAVAAGVDAPLWILARLAGISVERPGLGEYQVGLHMTRFDEAFFLGEDELARHTSHRL